jgi:hypothetical protein
MVTIRDLLGGDNIKLVFWYVAQVDEEALYGVGCEVLVVGCWLSERDSSATKRLCSD